MKKDFKNAGADKLIEIIADKTIEDFFLYDIDGIKNYLNLGKSYKVSFKNNGLEVIKKMVRTMQFS